MLEGSPWWYGPRRVGRLINSATSQAQNQGLELADPNIYPIYDLLEHVKGASPKDPKVQDLHDIG